MDNKTKTAIDTIYELEATIKTLSRKVDIIDSNVKLINNKLSKLVKMIDSIGITGIPSVSQSPIKKSTSTPPSDQIASTGKSGGLVIGKIKVFGRIGLSSTQAASGVIINVLNSAGDRVKERVSDRDGYWDVRLPAGRYGVEYIREGCRPAKITITLTEQMTSFEVK